LNPVLSRRVVLLELYFVVDLLVLLQQIVLDIELTGDAFANDENFVLELFDLLFKMLDLGRVLFFVRFVRESFLKRLFLFHLTRVRDAVDKICGVLVAALSFTLLRLFLVLLIYLLPKQVLVWRSFGAARVLQIVVSLRCLRQFTKFV